MSNLTWIIGTTFVISLIAFVGALTLFLNEKLLNRILLALVAFSAGALIGGAFLHLMPEAIIGVDIRWHHHHATTHPKIMPFSYLILIGDGIHNFIDGLVIAASFMVNFPVGMVTTLAIALHEIPQEIGDFGLLVYGGFERVKALILNYISAITVIFGGITGYLLYGWIGESIVLLLPFAAGNFIYIATTDLIPEIRYKESLKKSLIRFCVFLTGIGFMLAVKLF